MQSAPLTSTHGAGEQLTLSLNGFGPAAIDDPLTWGGTSPLFGDLWIVGLSGPGGVNQLFFNDSQSPAQLTVVPEPSTLVLAALGIVALAAWSWRRKW